jgi:hypothetical protein
VTLLKELDRRKFPQPDCQYYLAWAMTLTGDTLGVKACYARSQNWSGRWTIGLLLREWNPDAVNPADFATQMQDRRSEYSNLIRTRLLASEAVTERSTSWRPTSGSVPERLEGLRTVLGLAVRVGSRQALAVMLQEGWLLRLPQAEQLAWRGTQALLFGHRESGLRQLEQAAHKFGSRRAALVLGVALLEGNQAARAEPILQKALQGRHDATAMLLRAHLLACKGRLPEATQEFERLQRESNPRATYALRNAHAGARGASSSLSETSGRLARTRDG